MVSGRSGPRAQGVCGWDSRVPSTGPAFPRLLEEKAASVRNSQSPPLNQSPWHGLALDSSVALGFPAVKGAYPSSLPHLYLFRGL